MSAGPRPAVVLTFDNLGEASELERGTWEGTLGHHPSVTVALPRLLDRLEALDLQATFFVEALNCELYPAALCDLAARGHEVGGHGWRHERWAELAAGRERELLTRATEAFADLGLAVRAFRPPGGLPTAGTPGLLAELGYAWWSPPVEASVPARPPALPFRWELVDAYHLMEAFAPLRRRRGDGVRTPRALAEHLLAMLETAGGPHTLILHPFLMLDGAWWEGTQRVLERLAELRRAGRAWVGPGARRLEATPGGGDPR